MYPTFSIAALLLWVQTCDYVRFLGAQPISNVQGSQALCCCGGGGGGGVLGVPLLSLGGGGDTSAVNGREGNL